MKLHTLQN